MRSKKLTARVEDVWAVLTTDVRSVRIEPESITIKGNQVYLHMPAPTVGPKEELLDFELHMGTEWVKLGVDSPPPRDAGRLVIVERVDIVDLSRVAGEWSKG